MYYFNDKFKEIEELERFTALLDCVDVSRDVFRNY